MERGRHVMPTWSLFHLAKHREILNNYNGKLTIQVCGLPAVVRIKYWHFSCSGTVNWKFFINSEETTRMVFSPPNVCHYCQELCISSKQLCFEENKRVLAIEGIANNEMKRRDWDKSVILTKINIFVCALCW